MSIAAAFAPEITPAAQSPVAISAALYQQLRVLARARLRNGGREALLDTTALVHEAYLRMFGSVAGLAEQRQVLAYASRTMRSVIVDFARKRLASCRGGDAFVVTLTDAHGQPCSSGADDIMRVHDALNELQQLDPRLAQVVEMRYFGGLSEAQIAQAMGSSERTVRRQWEKARLLLESSLRA
jgi:RNA polymerase sigma factor (TIGR02999 family)